MNHPFKSFDEKEFKIIEAKPCSKKYLFHGSSKKVEVLDPKYNSKHSAYEMVHEYGVPVVFASDKPSNAFCYEPVQLYKETRESVGTSVYHRLIHGDHKILLGAVLKGCIYVLDGSDFYEVIRDDFELGQWTRSTEWISTKKVTPIDVIEISDPFDWEMLPQYEFLGKDYVGVMPAEKYLSLSKDPEVKKAILDCINKPFLSIVPVGLNKYL